MTAKKPAPSRKAAKPTTAWGVVVPGIGLMPYAAYQRVTAKYCGYMGNKGARVVRVRIVEVRR